MLALDAYPALAGFTLFLLATARPMLAGLGIAALGFGLGLTDRMKRLILREPVVFADRAELLEVVRHPRFYIAFVGTLPMIAGTLALLGVIALLVWAEPPLWRAGPVAAIGSVLLAAVLGRLAFVLPTAPPLLRRLAARYTRLRPSGDPGIDAARFGLLASLVIQATQARAERPARQAAVRTAGLPPLPAGQGPIILWQAESFVDVARLHPELADRLPHFSRLSREAALAGVLDVPAWGANTIRTELAAVAGIGPGALGLDRFNPYEAFVRVPLPSLAAQARAAGYTTVCVHPYSQTFYMRHKVMPLLGFDRFVGLEAFGDAGRDAGYVTDRALAEFVADLVRREGPRLFVFAISIENHGPWDDKHDAFPSAPLPASWRGLPDAAQVGRWLRHIEAFDTAMAILRSCLEQAGDGWLGVYGDHQPSLAGPFHAPGAPDTRTDYALWRVGGRGGERADIAAEDLARRWLGLMRAAAEASGLQ